MGLTYVTTKVKQVGSNNGTYEAQFHVDAGATDSVVSETELRNIGLMPIGKMAYELADGSVREFNFGIE